MINLFVRWALLSTYGFVAFTALGSPALAQAGYEANPANAERDDTPEHDLATTPHEGHKARSKAEAELRATRGRIPDGVGGGSTPAYSNDNTLTDLVTRDRKTSAK